MSLKAKIFASIYNPLIFLPEKLFFSKQRKELLGSIKGRVLEIGSGTGVNFPYYSPQAYVTAIEPSKYMRQKALQKLREEDIEATIKILPHAVEDPEMEREVAESGKFDLVVVIMVLCTIPEPGLTIAKISKWLKPGGKCLVLEHIHSHRKLGRITENALTPIWKHLAEGCHLNRKTDQMLHDSGLKLVSEKYFSRGFLFYQAVFIKPEVEVVDGC